MTLRERKKQRTRQALIDTALEQFTARGFAGVTLDELCEAVEVSKRTFFRNFASKEEVAMAPLEDMWRGFLVELAAAEPGGRPALAVARDALLASLDGLADGDWAGRALLSYRLSESTASMNAHSLHFCERTTQAAIDIIRPWLDEETRERDPRPRLMVDMLVAAFRYALAGWAADTETADIETADTGAAGTGAAGTGAAGTGTAGTGAAGAEVGKTCEELAARLREAVGALPASLTLTLAHQAGAGRSAP
ncbi:TetR/AcrR family transcriptional regulator [Nonomuraea zeae]|uniref:TetR/AcrR family transcriptional regulator n=1 Tax=Nonomuraea zeae TaxID=1642303 RepID=UPI00197EC507|nr:TetR family transcriptional regulator [Nonomuraea zeae]